MRKAGGKKTSQCSLCVSHKNNTKTWIKQVSSALCQWKRIIKEQISIRNLRSLQKLIFWEWKIDIFTPISVKVKWNSVYSQEWKHASYRIIYHSDSLNIYNYSSVIWARIMFEIVFFLNTNIHIITILNTPLQKHFSAQSTCSKMKKKPQKKQKKNPGCQPVSDSTPLSQTDCWEAGTGRGGGTSGGSWPSHSPMSSGCHSEWSWHGRYANPLSFKLSQEAAT